MDTLSRVAFVVIMGAVTGVGMVLIYLASVAMHEVPEPAMMGTTPTTVLPTTATGTTVHVP